MPHPVILSRHTAFEVIRASLETLFVERMDQNEEIFVRFMNDPAFRKTITTGLAAEAYQKLRS